jgi:hypothetical protein
MHTNLFAVQVITRSLTKFAGQTMLEVLNLIWHNHQTFKLLLMVATNTYIIYI